MRYEDVVVKRPPPLTVIRDADDLNNIAFVDGLAEVEVPAPLLDSIPLKHDERFQSDRLLAVIRSIRAKGYSSLDPIVCRIGARGRWVVVDGGHRLTAVKLIARDPIARWLGPRLGNVTFLLFQTPLSYSKLRGRKLFE